MRILLLIKNTFDWLALLASQTMKEHANKDDLDNVYFT